MTLALLLVVGLLSAALPCFDGAEGHHHAAGPAAASSVRVAPVAAASAEEGGGHVDPECVSGPSGHIPQGRPTAEAAGPGAPAVLGGAVRIAAARRATAGGGVPWHRPVRSGRSTLAALCRCRI
ncbi:hypothetical protein [Streptomyces inhibens]|uniref:hypothetical protein n=1 Tax=Streptomyces inhibens TaxID=2293571 RepID=UPI001EE6C838|nr:hypothetical protein [Streptomyces inhibens]UKY53451.1 hypothetical protein KI385_34735 [Streptomyces inhibens]